VITDLQLYSRRYHAVVHLVTAAIGAEKFYTLANNAARSESVEQVCILDIHINIYNLFCVLILLELHLEF
jgi:hypothetical protein